MSCCRRSFVCCVRLQVRLGDKASDHRLPNEAAVRNTIRTVPCHHYTLHSAARLLCIAALVVKIPRESWERREKRERGKGGKKTELH